MKWLNFSKFRNSKLASRKISAIGFLLYILFGPINISKYRNCLRAFKIIKNFVKFTTPPPPSDDFFILSNQNLQILKLSVLLSKFWLFYIKLMENVLNLSKFASRKISAIEFVHIMAWSLQTKSDTWVRTCKTCAKLFVAEANCPFSDSTIVAECSVLCADCFPLRCSTMNRCRVSISLFSVLMSVFIISVNIKFKWYFCEKHIEL